MTHAERLATFVVRESYDDLSKASVQQLKIRVLDALGCAIGALEGDPIRLVRAQVEEFGGAGRCTLVGVDGEGGEAGGAREAGGGRGCGPRDR